MPFGPDVVVEEFRYADGRTTIVYRTPYPTEGPVRAQDPAGQSAWMFMYAHFVFCWMEGASRVHVSHGSLAGPRMTLWTDVKITGSWSGPVLADFARAWVAARLGVVSGKSAAVG